MRKLTVTDSDIPECLKPGNETHSDDDGERRQGSLKKLSVVEEKAMAHFASSMSRIWSHSLDNGYPVAMITAFRGKKTLEDGTKVPRHSYAANLRRNKKLYDDLKQIQGISWIIIKGGYVEGYKTEGATGVEENSFFVIADQMEESAFKQAMWDLGAKYNQDSVAFKPGDSDHMFLLGTQDVNEEGQKVEFPGYKNEFDTGVFHPRDPGEFYSKWRGQIFRYASKVNMDPRSEAQYNSWLEGTGEVYEDGKVKY